MLTFIKRLLGLETAAPAKIEEEVKAIFAPYTVPAEPKRAKDTQGKFLADNPATPENEAWVGGVAPSKKPKVTKVRAITDTKPNAVKEATSPKPANKRRRPYRGNKVKAGAKVTEGTTKGGNNTVKPAQVAKAKPVAPKAPVAKKE
jgi:hypothetical protein